MQVGQTLTPQQVQVLLAGSPPAPVAPVQPSAGLSVGQTLTPAQVQAMLAGGPPPATVAPQQNAFQAVGTSLKDSAQKIGTDLKKNDGTLGGEIATGAGLAGDITSVPTNAIGAAIGSVVPHQITQAVGTAVQGAADAITSNPESLKALNTINSLVDAHPKIAELIGGLGTTAFNIASLDTGGKSAAVVKDSAVNAGNDIANSVNELFKETPPPAGTAVHPTASSLSNALEESSLRLTPVQKQTLGSKLADITQFNIDNGIKGDPETRYTKIQDILESKENQFQKFLNEDAADKSVSKTGLQKQITDIPQSPEYADSRDVFSVEKQAKELSDVLDKLYPTPEGETDVKIPVNRLNNFKRSTFSGAFNKAGNKVLDDVEFHAGDILKNAIEKATDGLTMPVTDASGAVREMPVGAFNKEYGTAIQSAKLLKIAASRPQLGLMGKLTSKIVSSMLGHVALGPLGEIGGALIGDKTGEMVAGTSIKSHAASLLNR